MSNKKPSHPGKLMVGNPPPNELRFVEGPEKLFDKISPLDRRIIVEITNHYGPLVDRQVVLQNMNDPIRRQFFQVVSDPDMSADEKARIQIDAAIAPISLQEAETAFITVAGSAIRSIIKETKRNKGLSRGGKKSYWDLDAIFEAINSDGVPMACKTMKQIEHSLELYLKNDPEIGHCSPDLFIKSNPLTLQNSSTDRRHIPSRKWLKNNLSPGSWRIVKPR